MKPPSLRSTMFNMTESFNTTETVSDDILFWLTSDGSLTALLEAKSGQPLKVERTFEGYRLLTIKQKMQLGYGGRQLSRPMLAWVRESLLYGNAEQPWVAAQSIFPLPSLKGEAKRLKHLQGTPIGYVLFKRQKTLPNQRTFELTDDGWRRNTVYDWYGRSLIISETFLPEFFDE